MSMEDVFADKPEGEPKVVEQQVEQVETQASPEQTETQGEPTSQNADKHVPLAALEAERNVRKDWKEKALRFEGEVTALRRQLEERSARQPQEPQRQMEPMEQIRHEMLNDRFNTSQMLAAQKYSDLDEAVEVFQEAAKANPALAMALQQQAHPYEFAYKEGKRLQLLKEVGDDPASYRQKLEEEIRTKVLAELQPGAPKVSLPTSLAGARSSATRSAPAFTGPTPLDNMFK